MNLKALTLALFLSSTEALGVKTKVKSMSKANALRKMDDKCFFTTQRIANDADKFNTLGYASTPQVDPDFPTDFTSIYLKGYESHYYAKIMLKKTKAWKRPSQIHDEYDLPATPTLFGSKGVQPHGVRQGYLGDCWFLASAAALAEHPKYIERLFEGNVNSDGSWPASGVFRVTFYVKGEPVTVLVDDQLPVNRKDWLLNSEPSANNAWWFVIMEKAYAKLNLNYNQIDEGVGVEAFRSLTGGPVQTHDVGNMRRIDIFNMIRDFDKHGQVASAVCQKEGNGLTSGHYYTVVGAHRFANGKRLIQMRNPWGTEAYKGEYSDLKRNSKMTDEMRAEVGDVKANDGSFWIQVKTFYKQFPLMYVSTPEDGLYKSGLKQQGKAAKIFPYVGQNPVAQKVIIAIDQGTGRMVENDCYYGDWDDLWLAMTVQSAGGRTTYAKVDYVPTDDGYAQVEVNLPAGEFHITVYNYGDTNLESDFSLFSWGESGTFDIVPY